MGQSVCYVEESDDEGCRKYLEILVRLVQVEEGVMRDLYLRGVWFLFQGEIYGFVYIFVQV